MCYEASRCDADVYGEPVHLITYHGQVYDKRKLCSNC